MLLIRFTATETGIPPRNLKLQQRSFSLPLLNAGFLLFLQLAATKGGARGFYSDFYDPFSTPPPFWEFIIPNSKNPKSEGRIVPVQVPVHYS
jgi:hypothetical protein